MLVKKINLLTECYFCKIVWWFFKPPACLELILIYLIFVSWLLVYFIEQKNCSIFWVEYFLWATSDACCAPVSCFCSNFFLQLDLISNTDLMEFDRRRKKLNWMSGDYFHGWFFLRWLKIRAKSYSIQLFTLSRLKSGIRTRLEIVSWEWKHFTPSQLSFKCQQLNIFKSVDNISYCQLFWCISPLFAFLHHIWYLTKFYLVVKDFLFQSLDVGFAAKHVTVCFL